MYKLLLRRTTLLVRRAMCSRVARVGTRASFDAEQKNRRQTHRPNAEHSSREGEGTVYTSRLEVARRMLGDVWR
jgi:hypothetical protein